MYLIVLLSSRQIFMCDSSSEYQSLSTPTIPLGEKESAGISKPLKDRPDSTFFCGRYQDTLQ